MNLTRKQFISYAVLPGIFPRFKELFASGFQYVPYFIALVYQSVRLLPANHPYLDANNIGKFDVRHVIAAAANNLIINHKNIDQIILFFAILTGLVLTAVQFALVAFTLFSQPVMAAIDNPDNFPTSFKGFFIAPNEEQDLANIMLDMTFGVPEIFNSCISKGTPCQDNKGDDIENSEGDTFVNDTDFSDLGFPFPIHFGLHAMFQIYSIALLIVASMITAYFIFAIIAETAQTGTAFGKRFNKVWAPIRLVVAFGLLVPISSGLNSSQYIVLYAAKYGSGFASNGWEIFNKATGYKAPLTSSPVSYPNVPEINGLLKFLFVSKTCSELEFLNNGKEVGVYLVKDNASATESFLKVEEGTQYEEMIEFINGDSKALIRFGYQDVESNPSEKGYVNPRCGEMIMPLQDPFITLNNAEERNWSVYLIQLMYWQEFKDLYFDYFEGTGTFGAENYAKNFALQKNGEAELPDARYRTETYNFFKESFEDDVTTAVDDLVDSVDDSFYGINEDIVKKGWAGAAIWYNKIAQFNGAVTSAAFGVPMPTKYPEVMEHVADKKAQQDSNVSGNSLYEPILANEGKVEGKESKDDEMARILYQAYSYWNADGHATSSHTDISGNAFYDFINYMFGTDGMFNMRKNAEVHPLAQLVGIGRSLIESAIRNVGFSTVAAVTGGAVESVRGLTGAFIGFAMTISTVMLTAGFVLFYIVPFLPFIYFFFAVGGWIKGIFEAMVGAPLWALAHIRIDGEGLPGQSAVNGYFLIFEIFLRPILIIFGLLASISIFGALVALLNQTWTIVTANVTGFDVTSELEGGAESLTEYFRQPIDEFFFTVIYTLVVYLMGMSSFKLIDLVPNSILRWMGQSVNSFNDQREDPAQGLVGTASIGTQQTFQSLGGGLKQALGTVNTLGGS